MPEVDCKMAKRKLAESTINRFRRLLEEKEQQLQAVIAEHEAGRSEVRMAETAAERSPDPDSADGGAMAYEFEKELSVDRNPRHPCPGPPGDSGSGGRHLRNLPGM